MKELNDGTFPVYAISKQSLKRFFSTAFHLSLPQLFIAPQLFIINCDHHIFVGNHYTSFLSHNLCDFHPIKVKHARETVSVTFHSLFHPLRSSQQKYEKWFYQFTWNNLLAFFAGVHCGVCGREKLQKICFDTQFSSWRENSTSFSCIYIYEEWRRKETISFLCSLLPKLKAQKLFHHD